MNTSCNTFLVYDIGGTNLRGAIYSVDTGSITSRVVRSTPSHHSSPGLSARQIYHELIKNIRLVSDELDATQSVSGVSLAFPGPVDNQGRIVSAPGIWGSNPSGPIDIQTDLQKIWPQLPVHIANDLTAAGYRYLESNQDSFCLLTVSTGIGNKIFIDGKPQLGPIGTGGEIGHAKVFFDENAPLCACGERGHLQAVSSGQGVLQRVRHLAATRPDRFTGSLLQPYLADLDVMNNHSIAKAYLADDPFTVKVIEESVKPLAATLSNLHLALGLERFILIGGFAIALGEKYRLALAAAANSYCWESHARWEEMLRFGHDDDLSGLIGAGRYALRHCLFAI